MDISVKYVQHFNIFINNNNNDVPWDTSALLQVYVETVEKNQS